MSSAIEERESKDALADLLKISMVSSGLEKIHSKSEDGRQGERDRTPLFDISK